MDAKKEDRLSDVEAVINNMGVMIVRGKDDPMTYTGIAHFFGIREEAMPKAERVVKCLKALERVPTEKLSIVGDFIESVISNLDKIDDSVITLSKEWRKV